MRILRLLLKNFRNHSSYSITPHSKINLFTGDNGQGKTAILEACSLLLFRKSFRQGRNWIQKGFDQGYLSLNFESKDGKGEIQVFLSQDQPLKYLWNGKKIGRPPFKWSGVFFTPEDLSSIRGEASHRRKLIDDLVLELPQGMKVIGAFRKILKERNKFLKLCKKGRYNLSDRKKCFHTLDTLFLQKSFELMRMRLAALKQIEPFWRKRGVEFLKTQDFHACYLDQSQSVLETDSQIFTSLEKEVENTRILEEIRGVSLAGPHRHDIHFYWQEHEARESLSHGQQRALLLSWKLGQWDQNFKRNQEPPVLFLDDVFSEIDQHFCKNLIEFLSTNQAQSFVTTTEAVEHLQNATTFHLGERFERDYDKTTSSVENI